MIVGFALMSEGSYAQNEQTVTLYSPIKYKNDFSRAFFSFGQGVRGEPRTQSEGNDYDLLYGNMELGEDKDWFSVRWRTEHRSQIKDLGKLEWSEVSRVPVLPALPPTDEGKSEPVTIDTSGGKTNLSPVGQMVKALEGHIYLVHTNNGKIDSYAIFRVEALVRGDNCRLTWKVVPSPGQ